MDKPLAIRRHWYYVEYDSFVEGTRESELQLPTLETWVRPAIIDEARKLYAECRAQKDPAKAEKLLLKLVSDQRMKSVWDELYKKRRVDHKSTDQFVNSIYVTKKSMAVSLRQRASATHDINEAKVLRAEASSLEGETYDPLAHTPWMEQDLGVQLFLWRTYKAALEIRPVFLEDIKAEVKKLRKAAEELRAQAATLQSLRIECEALQQIATNCASQARIRDHDPRIEGSWIITRRVNDPQMRTLVANLSSTTELLCKRAMYGTVATVANVVFDRDDMTGRQVREMLRLPPGA